MRGMSKGMLLLAETMRHDRHVPVLELLKLFRLCLHSIISYAGIHLLGCILLYLTLLHLPN